MRLDKARFVAQNPKFWANATNAAILMSAVLFFMLPHHEYVPKLICFAIACGFTVRHVLQRNIRAAILCAVAACFVLLTLPNAKWIQETETIVVLIALAAAGLLFRQRKPED
ncbi:MAG: hypothetical protein K6T83_05530 [Alicyclobacillus sp.]|nr:hypothetical protein [Alicyclobacillus sp.]